MAKTAYYKLGPALVGCVRECIENSVMRSVISRNNPDPLKYKENVRLDNKGDYGGLSGTQEFFTVDNLTKTFNIPRKIRKDTNALCGCIVSLPEELKSADKETQVEFFEIMRKASLRYWLTADMGYTDENFINDLIQEAEICSSVHFDESNPHLHTYFVPLKYANEKFSFCKKEVMPDVHENPTKFKGYHDYLQEELSKHPNFANVKVTDKEKRELKHALQQQGDHSMDYMSLPEYKSHKQLAKREKDLRQTLNNIQSDINNNSVLLDNLIKAVTELEEQKKSLDEKVKVQNENLAKSTKAETVILNNINEKKKEYETMLANPVTGYSDSDLVEETFLTLYEVTNDENKSAIATINHYNEKWHSSRLLKALKLCSAWISQILSKVFDALEKDYIRTK